MSLLVPQKVLAASVEGTSGTAETLDAADAVFNIMTDGGGPAITCETGFTQREGQNAFSPIVGISQGRVGRARFRTDYVGHSSGASPDWATTFLPGCGMSESSRTWSVVTGSSTAKTLTISEWIDGSRRTLYGAVGTFTINLVAGQPGTIDFEFLGIYADEADQANVAPTFPTVKPPRWAHAAGCVYNSQTLKCASATIAIGNELKLRENCNRTAGFEAGIITGRRTTVDLDPERVALATVDWMAAYTAATEAALTIICGTATNNIITVAGSKFQQYQPPQVESREGLAVTRLSLQGNRNAAAGDDEFTLVFS
jgi:hypothetical protein